MKFTIKTRLFLGFGILTVILIGLSIYAINSLGAVDKETDTIVGEWLTGVDYAHSLNTHTSDYRIKELQHVIATDNAEMDSLEKEMASINEDIKIYISKYNTVISNETDRKLIADIQMEWSQYLDLHKQVIALSRALKTDAAMKLLNGDSQKAFDEASNFSLELVKFNQDGSVKSSKKADEVYSNARNILIIAIILAVVISITAGFLITTSIVKPIGKLVSVADKLAVGDINVKIDAITKDEIGDLMASFEKMIGSIREQAVAVEKIAEGDLTIQVKGKSADDIMGNKLADMIEANNEVLSNISLASEQVAAGAKQVSTSAQMLSRGSAEQASSLEEITASINEISSQTKQNASNANQANNLALVAKDNALKGNGQMQEMVKAMTEINNSSANISKIIKVIDEIAFQTNILALNAAVEAARAGQYGKGFAVVAEEVRNLAARSANAAKETTEMIESSIEKVQIGTRIANSTAEALNEIVDGVAKAATLVGDIATASNEQATGIAQVTQAIAQVAQVVQNNSATAEESASASEELSSQAELMKNSVGRFRLKGVRTRLENGFNSDMIRMIEEIVDKKKERRKPESGGSEAAASRIKVSLEDDFGKY